MIHEGFTSELPKMTEKEARESGLYVVPMHCRDEAIAAFAKLAKRATRRLHTAAPVLEFVAQGQYRHAWVFDNHDGKGQRERSRMLPALFGKIIGENPKLNGWSLAARLQTMDTGERLLRTVPGVSLPERFRNTGVECEHCHTHRPRRDVFVVYNESTGVFLQVGRSCLRDFLGHDPAALLAAFVSVTVCRDMFDNEFGGMTSGARDVVDTLDALEFTAASIRCDGWHSRKSAQESGGSATADTVHCCFGGGLTSANERRRLAPTDSDKILATETLSWVRTILADQYAYGTASDYEHNLVVNLRHDVVDTRALGIACSAVAAYLRAKSREAELAAKKIADSASNWQGNVGERLRNIPVTVERKQIIESDFGSCYLLKMRDENGNLFSWFCSGRGADDVAPGQKIKLTGTVKAHKDFNGTRETQLSRCCAA